MWNKFYDSVDGIDFDKKGGIRMTIRQFINAEIEKLREKTKETTAALAILDNPNSSVAEKTRVMRFLFVANQALWAELFELTKPTNRKKVSVASLAPVVVSPVTRPIISTTATIPPRTLAQEKTPERRRDVWLGILSGFLDGKRIDPIKTCAFTTSIFQSGVRLDREHWEKFFVAMKKAARCGLPIFNSKASSENGFAKAPSDLVNDFVFGQDGLMVVLMVGISELNKDDKMIPRLVAQAWILVAALSAIECQMDEFDMAKIDDLLRLIKGVDGPDRLIREIQSFLPDCTGGPTTLAGGLRIVGDLNAVVRPVISEQKAPELPATSTGS
ncbi:MAG: hypothetical protein A3I19_00960 [Candidatus Zambryskibacteria bacterium RIFCSPLOWO2_02_FULL_38_13]|nr:MAG: hypothetical protein A3I19_00960 [Candidatus Zambryskibacteria bacterium RIFCSPLOWO2_02_FULL_38_13]